MSNLVDKAIELQAMTCLDVLLDRANHDEYLSRIGKKEALKFLEENRQYVEIIKSRLQRLEAIDNSNPSEALKCLKSIEDVLWDDDFHYHRHSKLLDTIKQALLKAQEPKQYLKWEDLEFKDYGQEISVLLNDNKYSLKYKLLLDDDYYMVWIYKENKCIISLDGHYSENKQFFNDLHLERVEE